MSRCRDVEDLGRRAGGLAHDVALALPMADEPQRGGFADPRTTGHAAPVPRIERIEPLVQ